MQSLMAAAHAAGYAMAAPEEADEALEVMPRRLTEEFVDEAEVEVASRTRAAQCARRALAGSYYRASWVRDWIASLRFGRATA
jgi:hypothetical protein